jgi:hypothetical protein
VAQFRAVAVAEAAGAGEVYARPVVQPGDDVGFNPQPDPPGLPAVRFSDVRV